MVSLNDYALPTVVREADFYHRYNRSAPIRVAMYAHGDNFTVVSAPYGVGPKPDVSLSKETVKKGFENDLFEQISTRLEQSGYELHWVNNNTRKGFTFGELRAKPLESKSVDEVLPKGVSRVPNIVAQRIFAGVRVLIVIDWLGNINMFDPHAVNDANSALTLSSKSSGFLRSALSNERSFATVLEGFYSDRLGLQITDGVCLFGDELPEQDFVARIERLSQVFNQGQPNRAQIQDTVAIPQKLSRADYRALALPMANNPVYLLRSASTACGFAFSVNDFKTIAIDCVPGDICALTTSGKSLSGFTLTDDLFSVQFDSLADSISYQNVKRHVLSAGRKKQTPVIL